NSRDRLTTKHVGVKLKGPANDKHVGVRENELASPLPALAQLSLFAHAGHVVARIADGAQDATLFGRKGSGELSGDARDTVRAMDGEEEKCESTACCWRARQQGGLLSQWRVTQLAAISRPNSFPRRPRGPSWTSRRPT